MFCGQCALCRQCANWNKSDKDKSVLYLTVVKVFGFVCVCVCVCVCLFLVLVFFGLPVHAFRVYSDIQDDVWWEYNFIRLQQCFFFFSLTSVSIKNYIRYIVLPVKDSSKNTSGFFSLNTGFSPHFAWYLWTASSVNRGLHRIFPPLLPPYLCFWIFVFFQSFQFFLQRTN